jgi:hypothetical protein
MHRFDRDDELVDRLLDGHVPTEDVPAGLAEVAALFEQATGEPTAVELSAQDRVVAAMATVLPDAPSVLEPRRNPLVHRLVKAKVATAVVVAGLGVGAAAAAVSTVASPSRPQTQSGAPTTLVQVTMPPTSAPATTAAPASSSPTTARDTPTTTSGTVSANATRSGKAVTTTAGAAVAARGPDALGPAAFGLCTAWHGGRETGNKLNAPPFVNLAAAADSFGLSVKAYCDEVFAAKQAAGAGGPNAADDQGRSGDDQGESDQQHGKSDEEHGNSADVHGNAGVVHGKSDQQHGKSGEHGS